jgi:hypothetical protein
MLVWKLEFQLLIYNIVQKFLFLFSHDLFGFNILCAFLHFPQCLRGLRL